MITIDVRIPGLRDLQGRFARFDQNLAQFRRDELRVFAPKVVSLLRKFAPVETGEFRDSLSGKVIQRGRRGTEVQFFSSDPKAPFVINPTRPHTIEASRGRALRFVSGSFRKSVMHPGTRGSDFAFRAFNAGGPEFIRTMNKAGIRAMFGIAGRGI